MRGEQSILSAWTSVPSNSDTVSRKILLQKLLMCVLDKQPVRCTENWLNSWAQSVMISGMKLETSS